MPIRPPPLDIRCPECAWQQHWQPASDALMALPPKVCPRCGHTHLETRPAAGVSALWGQLQQWLTRP